MTIRLSVNINAETEAALRDLSERKGISVTEVIRRAVSVYKFVEDQVVLEHKTLQVVDSDSNVTRLAVLG